MLSAIGIGNRLSIFLAHCRSLHNLDVRSQGVYGGPLPVEQRDGRQRPRVWKGGFYHHGISWIVPLFCCTKMCFYNPPCRGDGKCGQQPLPQVQRRRCHDEGNRIEILSLLCGLATDHSYWISEGWSESGGDPILSQSAGWADPQWHHANHHDVPLGSPTGIDGCELSICKSSLRQPIQAGMVRVPNGCRPDAHPDWHEFNSCQWIFEFRRDSAQRIRLKSESWNQSPATLEDSQTQDDTSTWNCEHVLCRKPVDILKVGLQYHFVSQPLQVQTLEYEIMNNCTLNCT